MSSEQWKSEDCFLGSLHFDVGCWASDVRCSSAFGGFDAEAAEGVGEVFEGVVEFVADVADAEAGALADLVVFEAFVVFERNERLIVLVEFGDEELEGADGFEFAEGLFGIGRLAFPFAAGFEGGFAFVIAEVVEGEISDGAEEPGAGIGDIFPMFVKSEESLLHEVLRRFPLADEAVGVAQER